MRIRVKSDGSNRNTQVFAIGEDGSEVELRNITSIVIEPITATSGAVRARLEFVHVELDIVADNES